MRALALWSITAYQRHLSPHKGFCCAYRSWTGCASCSALGYRAIRWHGVWGGLALLRRRFDRCAAAADRARAAMASRAGQAGFCDVGCPCDVASCDVPSCDLGGCDLVDAGLSFCDCGACDCGWPGKRDDADSAKAAAYVPPRRRKGRPRDAAEPPPDDA